MCHCMDFSVTSSKRVLETIEKVVLESWDLRPFLLHQLDSVRVEFLESTMKICYLLAYD